MIIMTRSRIAAAARKLKTLLWIAGICSFFLPACRDEGLQGQAAAMAAPSRGETQRSTADHSARRIDPAGLTVATRFAAPPGFLRVAAAENSFAHYLRQLPLKPHQAKVLLYDGRSKENNGIYEAVVDLPIGSKNLHQCADAVMRLRAEYFYRQKQFQQIHFNFTNGFRVDYAKWIQGYRVVVTGNQTRWALRRSPANSDRDFWEYLEVVFSYAGTLSLARELVPVEIADLQIGDVFIQGGAPGHAIIVVDLALHPVRREKMFILAQSYMPAQEIHILCNPDDPEQSPWYGANFGAVLKTPEWTFRKTDLKRFPGS